MSIRAWLKCWYHKSCWIIRFGLIWSHLLLVRFLYLRSDADCADEIHAKQRLNMVCSDWESFGVSIIEIRSFLLSSKLIVTRISFRRHIKLNFFISKKFLSIFKNTFFWETKIFPLINTNNIKVNIHNFNI